MSPIHEIIESIYNDKRVNEFISKLKPTYLQADLKSHCIFEIYRISNKEPGKIEALFKNNQLFAWFVGMAKMQLFSERSTFYRQYIREFEDEVHFEHVADKVVNFEFAYVREAEKKQAEEKAGVTADWIYHELERKPLPKPLAPAPMQLELFI